VSTDSEEVVIIEIFLKDIVAEARPVRVFVVSPDWELLERSHGRSQAEVKVETAGDKMVFVDSVVRRWLVE
jgi:hypothetical protein